MGDARALFDKFDMDKSGSITPGEVAEIFKVTEKSVRNWIAGGKLPAIRIGRTIRVRREALEAVLRAGEQGGAAR